MYRASALHILAKYKLPEARNQRSSCCVLAQKVDFLGVLATLR